MMNILLFLKQKWMREGVGKVGNVWIDNMVNESIRANEYRQPMRQRDYDSRRIPDQMYYCQSSYRKNRYPDSYGHVTQFRGRLENSSVV